MPAKSVTYNSQNYAGTLGSGLNRILCKRNAWADDNLAPLDMLFYLL